MRLRSGAPRAFAVPPARDAPPRRHVEVERPDAARAGEGEPPAVRAERQVDDEGALIRRVRRAPTSARQGRGTSRCGLRGDA
jgi:hypothetical protein